MVSNSQLPKPLPLKLSSIITSKNIAYVVKSLITRPKPICLSRWNNEKHNEFLIVFFMVAKSLSFAQCVRWSISFVANKSMLSFSSVIKYSPLCHFMMKPIGKLGRSPISGRSGPSFGWVACLLSGLLLLNYMCNPGANRFVRPHQNREVFCARNGAHLRIGSNGYSQIGKG